MIKDNKKSACFRFDGQGKHVSQHLNYGVYRIIIMDKIQLIKTLQLTADEATVLLSLPEDGESRIKLKDIKIRTKFSIRKIEALTASMKNKGVPIASSKAMPFGLWLTSDRNELLQTAAEKDAVGNSHHRIANKLRELANELDL